MSSRVQYVAEKRLATVPNFLPMNMQYETITGSIAYGVSQEESDFDVIGFCIPPREEIFPHLRGEILGFGTQGRRFEHWQQHHVLDPTARGGKGCQYDFCIFSIVKYFHLLMGNNPNIIDSLFTPQRCVLHITKIGTVVRDSRKLFLHKGLWATFKGYAYSQMHKMDLNKAEGKRKAIIERYKYDVKFGTHVVRLLSEAEQLLTEGDLDLERNREQLKSIRRGEWTIEQIKQYFSDKERTLEELYSKTTLPIKPDEERIKSLLLNCLEEHYGSLDGAVVRVGKEEQILREIKGVLERNGY